MQQEGFGLVVLVVSRGDGDNVLGWRRNLLCHLAQKSIARRTSRSFQSPWIVI
jgi:hypothetical protein